MKILGNLLLIPIKIITLPAIIITAVVFIISKVLSEISSVLLGIIIFFALTFAFLALVFLTGTELPVDYWGFLILPTLGTIIVVLLAFTEVIVETIFKGLVSSLGY